MEWIRPYLNNKVFLDLHNNVEKINKKTLYRSWIGLNFYNGDIISVKFYYTFYQLLNTVDLERIMFLGSVPDFKLAYDRVSLNDALDVNNTTSGFHFGLKFSPDLKYTFGFYFKQVFNEEDSFFELDETIKYFFRGGKMCNIDFVKNYSLFYDENGKTNDKNYYFIKDSVYKGILAELFDDIYLNNVPIIEFAVGKGHRMNEASNLSEKKILLHGDHDNISDLYIGKKINNSVINGIKANNFKIICPGFYADGKVTSVYFFDFGENSFSFLIEKLIRQYMA